MRFLLIILSLFPAAFFYSLAYLLKKPDDWTGPAVLLPLSFLATIISQGLILRRIRQEEAGDFRDILVASQVGSVALGILVGIMTYFFLLD